MSKEMKSEKDVKKAVKAALDKHNFFWWMPPANGFGRTGISDINAIRSGVFIAIETKFGDNKATAMQKAFLQSIYTQDGFAFVVSEKNIDWFTTWLAAFDRSIEKASKNQKTDPDTGATLLNAIHAMTGWMVD